ncbi:MAG: type 4a pilus biogenesis protein PilO [Desulfobacteraceae bacterium]|nr:type 4a pilus biogenesis protein PilO [Desulfobacteraceae bacterium]MCF8094543.1 type 4a pilus biogenesis protein PilO [Desulfobacteraceae bacterium]
MKNTNMSLQSTDAFFQKIGQLTKLQRILISVGAAVVVIAIFGYFLYLPKLDRMAELRDEIETSQQKLERTKAKANAYDAVKKRYDDAREQFELVARALPDKEEIPSLLTGISQAGKASGLKFLLFEPQSESQKDFYSEIPVKMELTGGYHDLGVFFDRLARLSRIVNVKDFSIARSDNSPGGLGIACTAVTYKFIEQPDNKK